MLEYIESVLTRNDQYRVVPMPVKVAGREFDFHSVLVGPRSHGNLVVLAKDDAETQLVKSLKSLIVILSRTHSTRPVTCVCVSTGEDRSAAEAISAFARTIDIPDSLSKEEVDALLLPLLPLALPDPVQPIGSLDDQFADQLSSKADADVARRLMRAARKGAEETTDTLVRSINEAVGLELPEVPCD